MAIIPRVHWQLTAPAFGAIYGMGLAPLLILPFTFSVLISGFDLSEAEAGAAITASLLAMCVGSFGVTPFVHRVSLRILSLFGFILVIVGNAGIAALNDSHGLIAWLLLAGLGAGVALAAGNASVASSQSPDEDYNHVVLLGTLLMIVLLFTIPRAMNAWSYTGVFGGLALIGLLMLPLLWRLPNKKLTSQAEPDLPTATGSKLYTVAAIAIVVMVFVYFVRDTMIWVYVELIGTGRFSLTPEYVATLFSVHASLSLFGPLVLLWLARRLGHGFLLLGSIAITGIITVTVSQTTSETIYAMMVGVWAMAHFFAYSCMMGLASRIDAKGQVAAAAGGAVLAGNAVAPAVATGLVGQGGYSALGVTLAVLVLITAGCALLALNRSTAP